MATTQIVVPDFQFSGFYYADILRRLRIFNRLNAPEISSEVAEEPFIQLERAFALVGHLNNVLLDAVANELLVPTLKLQDSARLLMKLIDFELRDYSPAKAELLVKIVQVLTSSQTVLEDNSLFETERTEDTESLPFETDGAVTVGPTNVVDVAWGLEKDATGTGDTVLGDADAFESTSASLGAPALNKEIQITGSILGNNGVFKVAEFLGTFSGKNRVRLEGVFGQPTPLFLHETGLGFVLRAYTADGSTALNTPGAPDFTPWADVEAGDKFYFGSSHVMFDEFDVTFDTFGANISGVWEYFDPDLADENPDDVVNLGGTLEFDLTSLLGTLDRSGALVTVAYLPTGVSETLVSTFSGGVNKITTTGFLGQSGTPSTEENDYSVGTPWNQLEGVTDGTANLTADGKVTYTLPQDVRANWQKGEVNGTEAFYVRYRVISVSTPTEPVIDEIDIDTGGQYLLVDVTQGETVTNEPTVSSNGLENQEFTLTRIPALKDSVQVFVDEGGGEIEWSKVSTLVTSGVKDRHFTVEQNSLGEVTVKFGDGTRGKIPTLGVDNIRFLYRINSDNDGNVGANTVVVNSGGSAFVSSVTNPRPAFGWREADGASAASLELVKEEGPASLRTLSRAVSPADYEDLALAFEDDDGTRPVVRAKAIEEGFGVKTIKLVVVGSNGVSITAATKDDLEELFNGNLANGTEGVGQSNYEVTVLNFTPRIISGLEVQIEANSALTVNAVKTRLATLLNPTALESDGVTFVWKFGGRIPMSRIASEIFNLSPGNVFDVDIETGGSLAPDLTLGETELPLIESSSLTVSITAPVV